MLSRTHPACSPEVEALITQTIGCAIQVHRTLGPGYTEAVYHDALAIELDIAHVPFEREFPVTLTYREHPLRPGLLINFHAEFLKSQLRRFVL